MTNFTGTSLNEQIKKVLDENLEYTKAIYSETLKIKRYIFWGRVMSFVQILFIVVPIIIGIIYLPSLIGDFINSVNLSGVPMDQPNLNSGEFNIKNLLEQYKDVLNIYK